MKILGQGMHLKVWKLLQMKARKIPRILIYNLNSFPRISRKIVNTFSRKVLKNMFLSHKISECSASVYELHIIRSGFSLPTTFIDIWGVQKQSTTNLSQKNIKSYYFSPTFSKIPSSTIAQKLYSSSSFTGKSNAKDPKSLDLFVLELSCGITN